MMKHLVILFALLELGYCELRTYRFVKLEGNVRIPQDIVYDTDANTVTIAVGDVPEYKNAVPTINFHDFDTGYVVFKDIRRQICLLSVSPIPFPMPLIYGLGETNMTLDYESSINKDLLSHARVTEIAGPRIASFCHDYSTFYMNLTKVPSHLHKRGTFETRQSSKCNSWCVICWLKHNKEELEYVAGLNQLG